MTRAVRFGRMVDRVAFMMTFLCIVSAEVYIVRMDSPAVPGTPGGGSTVQARSSSAMLRKGLVSRHDETLRSARISGRKKLYSYTHATNGFSAVLTPQQAAALASQPGVASVTRDALAYRPLTVRSMAFMGLDQPAQASPPGLWSSATGEGMIVGVIDTGIWPEARSFDPAEYGRPPRRWQGTCQTGEQFTSAHCNNKIIGARFFSAGFEAASGTTVAQPFDYRSPRDSWGHGSHVASVAAGNRVVNASIGGAIFGTAYGAAYRARLAIYKVCWGLSSTCSEADILAAFEAAIADGVDAINFSLGQSPPPKPYATGGDQGSLLAALAGIVVVAAAGNSGTPTGANPNGIYTVENQAPWYMSVALTNTDKAFSMAYGNSYFHKGRNTIYNTLTLGSGAVFNGSAITSASQPEGVLLPLLLGASAQSATSPDASRANFCVPGSLDASQVAGKIVVCDWGQVEDMQKGYYLKQSGAAGMIVKNMTDGAAADVPYLRYHVLPTSEIGFTDGVALVNYVSASLAAGKVPTAFIGNIVVPFGPQIGTAPSVMAFSSRGPNAFADIMKPEISAPGYYVMGAWAAQPSTGFVENVLPFAQDPRVTDFQVATGTSAAAPHVTGVAVLLKQLHPDWSPAMVFSAIQTTARLTNNNGGPILDLRNQAATALDMGAGFVDPSRAADPGLVYDAGPLDYTLFLCNQGYNSSQVKAIVGHKCPKLPLADYDYNSPSIMMSDVTGSGFLTERTVTNVGGKATYTVTVNAPPELKVIISPTKLKFNKKGESKTFLVLVLGAAITANSKGNYVYGSFTWSDGTHSVRSPIMASVTGVAPCVAVGGVCGDPRFVGGDGRVFYFHGKSDRSYCLVADKGLHINARFNGNSRKSHNATWVAALGFRFGFHNLTIAARQEAEWNASADHLIVTYGGSVVTLAEANAATWLSPDGLVTITRTKAQNSADVVIKGYTSFSLKAKPVVPNLRTKVSAYVHFDTNFQFSGLTPSVDGVLGHTYRSTAPAGPKGYILREQYTYESSSLLAVDCPVAQFSEGGADQPSIATSRRLLSDDDCTAESKQVVTMGLVSDNDGATLLSRGQR